MEEEEEEEEERTSIPLRIHSRLNRHPPLVELATSALPIIPCLVTAHQVVTQVMT